MPIWEGNGWKEGINKDMTILVDDIRPWRLQLSIGNTVSAAYHLNNTETKRELDVFVNSKRQVFQQAPKFLDVLLDRILNFKQHIEEVAGKVTSRVSLISIYGFTHYTKDRILENYVYTCNINNCYVCDGI